MAGTSGASHLECQPPYDDVRNRRPAQRRQELPAAGGVSRAPRSSTMPASTPAPPRTPSAFWEEFARELEWIEPWSRVLEWKPPYAKWFVGGKLNASVNCLDRHVRGPRRNKAAFIWEGEPGDRRTLTYWDLYRQVSAFANVLKIARRRSAAIASRSTCRSSPSSRSRCSRARASAPSTASSSAASARNRCAIASTTRRRSLLVTADGGYRRGQIVPAEADRRRGAARHAVDPARRRRPAPARRRRSRCTSTRGATTGTTA